MPSPSLDDRFPVPDGARGTEPDSWLKFPWLKYDLETLEMQKKMAKVREQIVIRFPIDKFEQHVYDHPHKAMVIFEDFVYTYAFMDVQANRVANAMLGLGLQCGDTVALLIDNEPAFCWMWLGLQKLGVAVAFINVNLRQKLLSYSVLATQPKCLVVGQGEHFHQAASDVLQDLQGLPVYVQGLVSGQVPAGLRDFDALMTKALPVPPDRSVRAGLTADSTNCYFYTSGTTGLPKPVYFSQDKVNIFASYFQAMDFTADDILYISTPLYHAAAGGAGWNAVIDKGATTVLKRKFSASQFWSDCRKHNVTVVHYLGELFRYILAQPKQALDSTHNVRAAFGNGFRKDIYEAFQTRFKIPLICEIFGATECIPITYTFNKPGVVGRTSPFLFPTAAILDFTCALLSQQNVTTKKDLFDPQPKACVKCDLSTAQPIRDKNGLCIKIKPGEVGLYLTKVPDETLAKGKFRVYRASDEENEKKLVHDVFEFGDAYFNFGDAMYLDKDYFLYFYDRLGHTFRWKAENVSTTEVANILTMPDFIQDANVYGVTIPGHDGKAGMAALTLSEVNTTTADHLKEIYNLCEKYLPNAARPLILRILTKELLTETFKQRKVDLIAQGYDPAKVKDAMYYLDRNAKTYLPLTSDNLTSFLLSRL